MLARPNRVVDGGDFRSVVRRGRRVGTESAVYYRLPTEPEAPMRFGFVVSRAVGDAVTRNRIRRRLKAVARQAVDAGARGEDIVVRVLPGAAERSFSGWHSDLSEFIAHELTPRRGRR